MDKSRLFGGSSFEKIYLHSCSPPLKFNLTLRAKMQIQLFALFAFAGASMAAPEHLGKRQDYGKILQL